MEPKFDFRDGLIQSNTYKNTENDWCGVLGWIGFMLVAWAWGMAWLCLFYYCWIFHQRFAFIFFTLIWCIHFAFVCIWSGINLCRASHNKKIKEIKKKELIEKQEQIERMNRTRMHPNKKAETGIKEGKENEYREQTKIRSILEG